MMLESVGDLGPLDLVHLIKTKPKNKGEAKQVH